jgi:hypothetical protein
MAETISTYICNKKLLGISISGLAEKARPQYAEVSYGKHIIVRMIPIGNREMVRTVNAYILPEGSLIDCIRRRYKPQLSWVRELVGLESNPRLSNYITVKANVPDLPCHLRQADVYTINLSPADHHLVFNSQVLFNGGEIKGGKAEANPLKTDLEFLVTERTLVPGELLQLAWTLKIDDKIYTGPVMGSWYATPLITGGKIISKVDDEDEDSNAYVVRVQDVNLVCLATDWAEYKIGDWAFVLKPGETVLDETKEYGSGDISQPTFGDTGYRLLPLTMDNFGNAHGDFEKKTMVTSTPEALEKVFKTTQHTGTITSVDYETGKASVVVGDSVLAGSFDNVPIFYHCPDKNTTEDGPSAFNEDDAVIVLNEGGGASPSASDLSIVGFKDDLKKCLYIFHIVRDDGVVMTDEHVELEYNSIVAATIDYEFAPFTGIYDPETETWQGKFEFDPLVDISGGLFIFITINGGLTLYTQYPYKYTSAAQWQPEDRIYPGRYEVAMPYWAASPILGEYTPAVLVDAINPGGTSGDIQEADLWELRDLVDASVDLPPFFYIRYYDLEGKTTGLSKPFFANGGLQDHKWKITSSVPFKAKTTIKTDRSVPCPDTSYVFPSWNNPLGKYMPCGAYVYRPIPSANTPESCCESGQYKVDPVSGWQKRVEEHGCFNVSRYDDSEVDALIRQGKIRVTCHNSVTIDVEAARVDDAANDGVRTTPESDHPPTFTVIKNDETPPFATPVMPVEIEFTGETKETTTFTSHQVCCQCYTYDEEWKRVFTHNPTPADYVATGKNVYPTVSFTPIQV